MEDLYENITPEYVHNIGYNVNKLLPIISFIRKDEDSSFFRIIFQKYENFICWFLIDFYYATTTDLDKLFSTDSEDRKNEIKINYSAYLKRNFIFNLQMFIESELRNIAYEFNISPRLNDKGKHIPIVQIMDKFKTLENTHESQENRDFILLITNLRYIIHNGMIHHGYDKSYHFKEINYTFQFINNKDMRFLLKWVPHFLQKTLDLLISIRKEIN